MTDGSDITCTFTNTRKTGTLQVVKQLEPEDDEGRFDLRINGNVEFDGAGDGDATDPIVVPAGTHTVAETGDGSTSLADYASSIACTGDAGSGDGPGPVNVAVVDGADVVCTITNRHKAMMTVVKQVVNEAGEVDTEQLFTFTPEPGAPFVAAPATTFALADDGVRGPVSTAPSSRTSS